MFKNSFKEYQSKSLQWLVNCYEQVSKRLIVFFQFDVYTNMNIANVCVSVLICNNSFGKVTQGLNVAYSEGRILVIQGLNVILADEMGEKYVGPFLVVAPTSVLNNWADEISHFCPNLKTLPYWGGLHVRMVLRKNINPKRLYQRDAGFHILITSYQLLVSDEKYFQHIIYALLILQTVNPGKTEVTIRCKLSSRQQAFYHAIKNKISLAELCESEMSRDCQVCNHPEPFERNEGSAYFYFAEIPNSLQPPPFGKLEDMRYSGGLNPIAYQVLLSNIQQNDWAKCLSIGSPEAEAVVSSALWCLVNSNSSNPCEAPTSTFTQRDCEREDRGERTMIPDGVEDGEKWLTAGIAGLQRNAFYMDPDLANFDISLIILEFCGLECDTSHFINPTLILKGNLKSNFRILTGSPPLILSWEEINGPNTYSLRDALGIAQHHDAIAERQSKREDRGERTMIPDSIEDGEKWLAAGIACLQQNAFYMGPALGAYVEIVLDLVVLIADPNRKFSFKGDGRQSVEIQNVVKKAVDTGHLEFVNGGWCMHDEATTHYIDMIDQTALGYHVIETQFNKVPGAGWLIDPFGHCSACRKSLGPDTFSLGDALGIAQHHDAVSGTAKQHTTNDYAKHLAIGSYDVVVAYNSLGWNCTDVITIPDVEESVLVKKRKIGFTLILEKNEYTIKEKEVDLPIQKSYLWYASSAGDLDPQAPGAYIFWPNGSPPSVVLRSVLTWPVDFLLEKNKSVNLIIFELKIGPIPSDDGAGREVITRMTASMVTNKEFYTDSNGDDGAGREVITRMTASMVTNKEFYTDSNG
ncbi:SNF2, N-terminal [Dillenia turbinata]|uniref:SNF2, N-terminal n=1 Tax=Dillenia turbinata TaxID=194707 RepID=A0AAN8W2L3_9MAGN